MPEPNPFVASGRVFVIHAPQPVIAVNFGVNRRWRFTHPRNGELPVVASVECCRVQDEDWDFRRAAPVVVLGMKVDSFAYRPDLKLIQPPRLVALAVFDTGEDILFIQL